MGCDIHAAIEINDGEGWQAVRFPNRHYGRWENEPRETCRLDFGRNYDAFAILADVRNGVGVAGLDTGDGFVPMSQARGLPDDISEEAREEACTGDHSDTYVTFEEMLGYDWTRTTKERGVVSAVQFEKWDRVKEWNQRPDEYCGDVSGGGVRHISADEMRELVALHIGNRRGGEYADAIEQFAKTFSNLYCRIEWTESYTEAAGELWEKWFPIMLKLSREHKQVRMVMNFDS